MRQREETPLLKASEWSHPSVVEFITERLPYQVLERDNDGVCVCVWCESLMGVGGQVRHLLMWLASSMMTPLSLPNAAPGSCASRPLWSTRGGLTIST